MLWSYGEYSSVCPEGRTFPKVVNILLLISPNIPGFCTVRLKKKMQFPFPAAFSILGFFLIYLVLFHLKQTASIFGYIMSSASRKVCILYIFIHEIYILCIHSFIYNLNHSSTSESNRQLQCIAHLALR